MYEGSCLKDGFVQLREEPSMSNPTAGGGARSVVQSAPQRASPVRFDWAPSGRAPAPGPPRAGRLVSARAPCSFWQGPPKPGLLGHGARKGLPGGLPRRAAHRPALHPTATMRPHLNQPDPAPKTRPPPAPAPPGPPRGRADRPLHHLRLRGGAGPHRLDRLRQLRELGALFLRQARRAGHVCLLLWGQRQDLHLPQLHARPRGPRRQRRAQRRRRGGRQRRRRRRRGRQRRRRGRPHGHVRAARPAGRRRGSSRPLGGGRSGGGLSVTTYQPAGAVAAPTGAPPIARM